MHRASHQCTARASLFLLALLAAATDGLWAPLRVTTMRRSRHSAKPCLVINQAEPEEGVAEWPDELHGPWELRTTLPGTGSRLWVELAEDGSCTCSSAVGKGSRWQAMRQRGKLHLRFVLLDKLKRPITYEGVISDKDGVHRLSIAGGTIRGPPRRATTNAMQLDRGTTMGEFTGFALE